VWAGHRATAEDDRSGDAAGRRSRRSPNHVDTVKCFNARIR
jgi:hypothetical protein